MPAVSKAQQRFMGMVYATKKGEMTNPSPEVAKAAASIKKKDAKDFASTKHKKLPEKKVAKEATDFAQRDKIMKKAKPLHKHLYKRLHKKDTSGDVNEKLDRKTKKDMDDFFRKAFKAPIPHELEETTKYDKYDKEKKQFAKADRKMKFGKFVGKAREARDRLRPGEVKRYDKKLGRYVSNKD